MGRAKEKAKEKAKENAKEKVKEKTNEKTKEKTKENCEKKYEKKHEKKEKKSMRKSMRKSMGKGNIWKREGEEKGKKLGGGYTFCPTKSLRLVTPEDTSFLIDASDTSSTACFKFAIVWPMLPCILLMFILK